MQVLVLGAAGFIGRQIVARLLADGHNVVATARKAKGLEAALPGARFVEMDLADATSPDDWGDVLRGVDAIVNAAGVLRGPELEAVHVAMPRALYAAALRHGCKRAVLISAISARHEVSTPYAQSKLRGEAELRNSGLNWTILKPSLVYGAGSYGGTSLLRGLAAMPFATPIPAGGPYEFSPIHAEDLARAVARVIREPEFSVQVLEPCGPDRLSHPDLLESYRRWLGFGAIRFVVFPMPLMRLIAWWGDRLGDGPVSSASLAQLVAGNAGDGDGFARAVGFQPRSLADFLRANPAQVQDRWHARLYFLAPAMCAILVAVWLASAVLGLLHGQAQTQALCAALGWSAALADPLRIGASLADLGVAGLVLSDRSARMATPVQLAMVAGYTLLIGFALPALWLDPLGPLLKNIPFVALVLAHGAIADNR